MKYKVGDKVRVASNLMIGGRYGNCTFLKAKERYKGKIVTISEVHKDYYYIKGDEDYGHYTDEMLESVEELTAEELVKIISNICEVHNECEKCPIIEVKGEDYCMIGMGKNADKTLNIAKQWKANHEKKPIETENVMYIVVMDEKRNAVYEEKTNEAIITSTMKEEVLKKYCSEHDGKYYAISERRCVVKE